MECLVREGVRYVFGIPGDRSLPFLDAIHRIGRRKGLEFITTRHEQVLQRAIFPWSLPNNVEGGTGLKARDRLRDGRQGTSVIGILSSSRTLRTCLNAFLAFLEASFVGIWSTALYGLQ